MIFTSVVITDVAVWGHVWRMWTVDVSPQTEHEAVYLSYGGISFMSSFLEKKKNKQLCLHWNPHQAIKCPLAKNNRLVSGCGSVPVHSSCVRLTWQRGETSAVVTANSCISHLQNRHCPLSPELSAVTTESFSGVCGSSTPFWQIKWPVKAGMRNMTSWYINRWNFLQAYKAN